MHEKTLQQEKILQQEEALQRTEWIPLHRCRSVGNCYLGRCAIHDHEGRPGIYFGTLSKYV
jgi:hypothetical protein